MLVDWFDDIGVTVENAGFDWGMTPPWYFNYDLLEIYFSWWSPDYLDPFNMLDPLFSNISISNTCQVNDPWVMGNLSLALQTTDDNARNKIYRDIQWRLFAELYVHAPFYHSSLTMVYSADLYDISPPVDFYASKWWALPVKRNMTWEPEI
jgi:ABC-type transport system substrate-binding protein